MITWFFPASRVVTTLAKPCFAGSGEEGDTGGSMRSSWMEGKAGLSTWRSALAWLVVPVLLVHLLVTLNSLYSSKIGTSPTTPSWSKGFQNPLELARIDNPQQLGPIYMHWYYFVFCCNTAVTPHRIDSTLCHYKVNNIYIYVHLFQ